MKKKANTTSSGNLHSNLAVGAAVVIFALVLFSIAGNNSLTGAYHLPGGVDRLHAVNISFTQEINSFSVYLPSRGLVTQEFLAMRVHVAPADSSRDIGVAFKFDPNPGGWADTAWVVVRNRTASSLLTGSVIYYNGSNYVVAQQGGYYQDVVYGFLRWNFVDARLPLHFVNAAGFPNSCMHNDIRVYFEPNSAPLPRATFAQIEEYKLTCANYRSQWLVKWNSLSASRLNLTGVYYQPMPRLLPLDRVSVGFVADTGSSLAGSSFNNVLIKYVYNASIVTECPVVLG